MWGVAQNLRARVAQVLVFSSIYQGAMLVYVSEPQPCVMDGAVAENVGNSSLPEALLAVTASAFMRGEKDIVEGGD